MSSIRKTTGGTTRSAKTRRPRARAAARQDLRKVVKVGLHFGDSKTRVAASKNGDPLRLKRDVFTNIVGFLRLHAPLARLPGKSEVLYAEQAVKFLEQVDLRKPIHSGLVNDVRVCRQFITHVCSAIDPSGNGRLWGVASIPAMAGPEELEKVYRALKGPLERVVVVPEPYLAAEGMRLDKEARQQRLGQDLTRNALVIDIGAGTTDICLLHGGFPTPEDQVRIELAGNSIDDKIFTNALVHSPTLFLSRRMAREIKEEQAFIGGSLAGETQRGSDLIALTDVIRKACDMLLLAIVEASCGLLGRCEPDVAAAVSRAIILTGGGSRIRNLATSLEGHLRSRGFPEAKVLVPQDYQSLVAQGALRFAEKLNDEEWRALSWRTPAENSSHFDAAEEPSEEASPCLEPDCISWMDVGLRAEASPAGEPEGEELSAGDPEPPAEEPPPRKTRRRKEKGKAITEGDIEERLEFFRTL
jgi:rod shape-determining protein MreB